jgi:hypothetical protein
VNSDLENIWKEIVIPGLEFCRGICLGNMGENNRAYQLEACMLGGHNIGVDYSL